MNFKNKALITLYTSWCGLGFMRGFVNQISATDYPVAMLHFAYLTPGLKSLNQNSRFEDVSENFTELMCPNDKAETLRSRCREIILRQSQMLKPTTTFFDGTSLSCVRGDCNYAVSCRTRFLRKPCETKKIYNAESTEWTDQVKVFLQNADSFSENKEKLYSF